MALDNDYDSIEAHLCGFCVRRHVSKGKKILKKKAVSQPEKNRPRSPNTVSLRAEPVVTVLPVETQDIDLRNGRDCSRSVKEFAPILELSIVEVVYEKSRLAYAGFK